ncbi:MAG: hypothetical protein A2787_03150 [Omnitrophica WOR_2 bacterium RIFCSPHIGHO2_01_FULL_48_9]|nr:MAG: hypothetical protein A3D10_01185 [Omnitrophica WOR_2 bacterium RIFCSPHIGHO2_02_FULL_48_11]OGX32015.1 MAG: hypothetical protein A2787_03150 [Omnitrophica WOR_2 bacterium RIFCSPHIGHO2_01_FULL_48_9]
MRNLIIALLIIFILAVIFFAAAFIFLKTVDINKFKSQIITQLETAVGREVGIQDMAFSFSFRKGIVLKVSGLTIANDPGETEKNFLEVEHINIDVDFMVLLRERRILVKNVEVNSPRIVLIRSAAGVLNVQTLGQPSASADPSTDQLSPSAIAAKGEASANKKDFDLGALPAVLVKSIGLHDGKLLYIDRALKPGLSVAISMIDVQVTNFSLKDKFHFSVAAAVLGKQQNTNINGSAQLDLRNLQARLDDTRIAVNLSAVLPEEVLKVSPAMENFKIVRQWHGMLDVTLNQMAAGAKGLMVLSLDGQLKNGGVSVDVLAKPVENFNVIFNANESDFIVRNYALNIGTGKIFGEAKVAGYLKEANFSLAVNLEKVKIEEVHDMSTLPVKGQGNVFGQFKAQSRGLEPQAFLQSLTADGSAEVRGGKFLDLNVLGLVLDKLGVVPPLADVTEKIQANLSEKYRWVLRQKDTNFQKIQFDIKVENQTAHLTRADIQAEGFGIAASGTCDFNQNLHLESAFAMAKDLSMEMGTAVSELELLFDNEGQIYIPFTTYDGPAAQVKMFPDPAYLTKRIVVNRGKEELQKLIDKALGNDETDGQPSSGEEKPAEEKIIGDILDAIFH